MFNEKYTVSLVHNAAVGTLQIDSLNMQVFHPANDRYPTFLVPGTIAPGGAIKTIVTANDYENRLGGDFIRCVESESGKSSASVHTTPAKMILPLRATA